MQQKTINSMELLQKWMEVATEEGDLATQQRLLELMRNETDRASIQQHWQEGDDEYLVGRVYPHSKHLAKGERLPIVEAKNGKH